MEVSGYYNKGKLLKEGYYYSFKYIKCVTLEDDNKYMIFEDQFGIRHFIEYEPYKAYNLSISDNVNCLVAKINCTGRIYLEPEHPVYKAGNNYSFEIILIKECTESLQLTVKDCFDNQVNLTVDFNIYGMLSVGKTIPARVESIKKGIPELVNSMEIKVNSE